MTGSAINEGDIVVRRSYGGDVFFRVVDLKVNADGQVVATLIGVDMRIKADAPVSDLARPGRDEFRNYRREMMRKTGQCMRRIYRRRRAEREKLTGEGGQGFFFEQPGRVLHLDGDAEYLKKCVESYRNLGLQVVGQHVAENRQAEVIHDLLVLNRPDILVLTGHDALLKGAKDLKDLNNYRSSRYFQEAVIRARAFEPGKDDLIIFAGACQSNYEALLEAGANYASAPKRVLIHALDPVFIVEKIAYTRIGRTVSSKEVITSTITGIEGIGGLETRGKLRLGMPAPK